MKLFSLAYAGTLIVVIWFFVTKNFYRDQLGDLMLPKLNIAVAAIFYAFFVVAIVILAVLPRLEAGSFFVAIGYDEMLRLDAYGTYDMTNLSTIGGVGPC